MLLVRLIELGNQRGLAGPVLFDGLEGLFPALTHALEVLLEVHDDELGGVRAVAGILELTRKLGNAIRGLLGPCLERLAARLQSLDVHTQPADLARAAEHTRRRAQPAGERSMLIEDFALERHKDRRR